MPRQTERDFRFTFVTLLGLGLAVACRRAEEPPPHHPPEADEVLAGMSLDSGAFDAAQWARLFPPVTGLRMHFLARDNQRRFLDTRDYDLNFLVTGRRKIRMRGARPGTLRAVFDVVVDGDVMRLHVPPREAFLVVSLLPPEEHFREGIDRLVDRVAADA